MSLGIAFVFSLNHKSFLYHLVENTTSLFRKQNLISSTAAGVPLVAIF
jgi:hypothetical protein